MSDDGYQLGTPVVPGSDNFTITTPAGCENARGYTQLLLTDDGFWFNDGTKIGRTGCIYVGSGVRIQLTNRAPGTIDISATQAIFGYSSATLKPNESMTHSTAVVKIPQGGSLKSQMRGSANVNVLDVVLCLSEIFLDPF
jgi:hypothetical protein